MPSSIEQLALSQQRVHNISFWLSAVSTAVCIAFALLSFVTQLTNFFLFFLLYASIYGVICWRNQVNLHYGNATLLFIAIDSGVFVLSLLISNKPVFASTYMLLMAFPFFYSESKSRLLIFSLACVPLATYLIQLLVQSYWVLEPLQTMSMGLYFFSTITLNIATFGCAMMIYHQFSLDRIERIRLVKEVNKQAQTYDLLDKAWQESERVSQEKNKLLLTIGHELRTPLTSIIGHLDIIDDASIAEHERQNWEQIKLASRSLTGLLDDVLEYSEFYNGNQYVDRQAVDVAQLCQLVIQDNQQAAQQLNTELQYNGPTHCQITTDANKFRRILNHLVSNAMKFRQSTSVVNHVSVGLIIEQNQLFINVSDEGVGISDEQLEKIFTAFWQPDNGLARQHQGNGLGLYLSNQLTNLLGGELHAKSHLDQGSKFTLTLPLQTERAQVIANQSKEIPYQHAMVVEDNPVNRKVMLAMLERLNVKASVMENGQDAVENYLTSKPDVILMDLQMPVLDGLEATRLIRKLEKQHKLEPCPIIAVSANATQHDQAQASSAGMNNFLVKPYRFAALKAVLSQ